MGEVSGLDRRREWLRDKAAADAWLGQRDESPGLFQLVSDLRQQFEGHQARFRSDSEQLSRAFTRTLEKTDAELEQAGRQIEARFEQLGRKLSGPGLHELSTFLKELTGPLYSNVRARLNLRLQGFSPLAPLFSHSQLDLNAILEQARTSWPEALTLVIRKAGREPLQGKCILDLEGAEIEAQCTRSRWLPWCRLRYRLARARCSLNYRIRRVPVLDTLTEHFPPGLTAFEKDFSADQSQLLERLKAQLDESWQVLRFNLELASVTLSEEIDPLREAPENQAALRETQLMLQSAFERTRELLKELELPYQQRIQELCPSLQARAQAHLSALEQDLLDWGTPAARLRWYRRTGQRRLQAGVTWLTSRLKRDLSTAGGYLKRAYYYLEDVFLLVGSWLGLSIGSKEKFQALADLPQFADIQIKLQSFPPIYRRLFANEPLLSEEFLVGRQGEIQRFQEVLGRWQEGRRASAVIVGQVGSGKTSLLNSLNLNLAGRHEARQVEFRQRLRSEADAANTVSAWFGLPTDTPAARVLEERLRGLSRQVVFIEAGHHLMRRAIGGRQAAEAFLSLLLATSDHFLWVLTIRERPWAMLNYQVNAERYFTHEFHTRFAQIALLKEALLARNRTSGCRLFFSEAGLEDRTLRKLRTIQAADSPAVQAYLSGKFFTKLFDVTGGNMTAAMFFWLTSLEYDALHKTLRLRPLQSPDLAVLRRFDSLPLFTLAEILNHGVLHVREHAEIFQLSPAKSQLVFDHLAQFRLIERERDDGPPEEGAYMPNPVLIHQIDKTLESMNILY